MNLTLEEALEIQAAGLRRWEMVLKPEVFGSLCHCVARDSQGVTNPYKIPRGDSLNEWVLNYHHHGGSGRLN